MSLAINIANILISIKGNDFLKNLNAKEKKLLSHFVCYTPPFLFKEKFIAHVINRDNTIPTKEGRPFSLLTNNLYFCFRENIVLYFHKSSHCLYIFFKKASSLYILKLLLEVIMASRKSGIFIHASSIKYRKEGYVFVGKGGSGKSTVVYMLGGRGILSDDTAIIRKINNSYRIFANPWWNEREFINIKCSREGTPLKAIFFIKKAKKTVVRKINYKESLSLLMHNKALFQQSNLFPNKNVVKNIYLFFLELIKRVPVFELHIRKSHQFRNEFNNLLDHEMC